MATKPGVVRMSAEDDVRYLLTGFLAGHTPFERLTRQLRGMLSTDPAVADSLANELRDLVGGGRLPYDLGVLIWQSAASELANEAEAANDDAAPAPTMAPSAHAPDAGGGAGPDQYRRKVDEVVISALVDDFRRFRKDGKGRGPAPTANQDKHLDAALADFRGARFRREATKAQTGQGRRAQVDVLTGNTAQRAIGVGSMLKDRFVLDQELGRGGMGIVYRAVDRRRLEAMHQYPYVALKLLYGDFRAHPDALRTLESEARKAQELAHPNIVTIFDFDRDGQEIFIVMELLQGRSLEQALRQAAPAGIEGNLARKLLDGICEGLAYAHVRSIVHADLKPANIFVLGEDQVKLLDFGIASAGAKGGFDAGTLGAYTAAYASPEMADGAPRDPRDDIYALGCIAYMLLTGTHPFDRLPGAEVGKRGLTPKRPDGVTSAEWQALARSLSVLREGRQKDASAFHAEFFSTGFFKRLLGS